MTALVLQQQAILPSPVDGIAGAFGLVVGWAKQLQIGRPVRAAEGYRYDVVDMEAVRQTRPAAWMSATAVLLVLQRLYVGPGMRALSAAFSSLTCSFLGSAFLRVGLRPRRDPRVDVILVKGSVSSALCFDRLSVFALIGLNLRQDFLAVSLVIRPDSRLDCWIAHLPVQIATHASLAVDGPFSDVPTFARCAGEVAFEAPLAGILARNDLAGIIGISHRVRLHRSLWSGLTERCKRPVSPSLIPKSLSRFNNSPGCGRLALRFA